MVAPAVVAKVTSVAAGIAAADVVHVQTSLVAVGAFAHVAVAVVPTTPANAARMRKYPSGVVSTNAPPIGTA